MELFNTFTLLLILAAAFGYLNTRFVRLPPTIGYMLGALALSLVLLFLRALHVDYAQDLIERLGQIDFSRTVLYGLLSFLLFAGALQFNLEDLAREKGVILTLATLGVIISTFVVGTLMVWIFRAFGVWISYAHALLFGALISPTDPVIVIGLLKGSGGNRALKTKIMGEALFNDGVAIVLFTSIYAFVDWQATPDAAGIVMLLLRQILGSVVLGLLVGWITHRLLSSINVFSVQVLLTLGFVAVGYDVALVLGTSGPIAVVIAGLIVRNYKPQKRAHGRHRWAELYRFWEVLDEFLNAVLFLMMGLELLTIPFIGPEWAIGAIAIVVVLVGRYVSVWIPIRAFGLFRRFTKYLVPLLTWGGLRGGISLALALSLPRTPIYNAILAATYLVVLFSTLVQGMTVRKLVD